MVAMAPTPITAELLQRALPGAKPAHLEAAAEPLAAACALFSIDTQLRRAHFLAQVAHESGQFSVLRENLNYTTPARLMAVYGKRRFPSTEIALAYVKNPEKLANLVYGSRVDLGNRGVESGDGWKYRGRGYIQLTGRSNYIVTGQALGVDFEANPDLVAEPKWAGLAAGCFWQRNAINPHADRDDLDRVTRIINGGTNGLAERREFLHAFKRALAR